MGCHVLRVKGPSLGLAGREQRQAAPTCMHALLRLHTSHTAHAVLEACSSSVAPASTGGLTSIRAAEWETCTYQHVCLHTLQGGSAPGSPGLSLPCWGWSGPLAMPKAPSMRHPSPRSSPNLSAGQGSPNHAVPLCRTGYATPIRSPGKPSLAGSSGSAWPDLPA